MDNEMWLAGTFIKKFKGKVYQKILNLDGKVVESRIDHYY